jgi:hypothetical protein
MRTGDSDHDIVAMRDAAHAAERSLTEACAVRTLSAADTGELIRVDALVDRASDALKRAIVLRRRKRAADAARDSAAMAAMADLEVEASSEATHRILRDRRGVRWDVFAVYTNAGTAARWHLKTPYSQGWLCFDSVGEKRRLAPIPAQWYRLGNAQLEALTEIADVVSADGSRAQHALDSLPSQGENRGAAPS